MRKYFRLLNVKTFFAIIGILLFIVTAFYFFIYIPRINTIKILKKELQKSYVKLNQMQVKVNSLPNPQKRIEEVEAKMAELDKKISRLEDTPALIKNIVKKIKDNNLDIISIEPKEEEAKKGKKRRGIKKAYIELKLTGNFKDFGKFVELLEGMNPVFTIESLEIASSQKQLGKVNIDLVLARYVYNK